MKRPEIERITSGVIHAIDKNPGNLILKDFEAVLIWVKVLEEEHRKPAQRVCNRLPLGMWESYREDDAPPQEGRIPIEDRPKVGELWLDQIGDPVLIWTADSYGRSFGYLRLREHTDGLHVVWGRIGQNEILDGKARRAWARTPDGCINNCAVANGCPAEECQLCGGYCPDHQETWHGGG